MEPEIVQAFNSRKKEAKRLGFESVTDLMEKVLSYEMRRFSFEPNEEGKSPEDIRGTKTPSGGYLTINEANMILNGNPVVGNFRHLEARDSLDYINARNFYNELKGEDNYNLYVPV